VPLFSDAFAGFLEPEFEGGAPVRLSAQCQPHRSNPALEFRAQENFHAVMSNAASLASTLLMVRMSLPTSYGFAIAAQNPNLRQSRMTGSES